MVAASPTDDLTLVALVLAAQCSSQQLQIMEPESSGGARGGGRGDGRGKLGCSLALKADLMYGATLSYYSTPVPPKRVCGACLVIPRPS